MSEFNDAVKKYLNSHSPKELAREFEVSVSTVIRWARGIAKPHPLIIKQILRSIEDLEDTAG